MYTRSTTRRIIKISLISLAALAIISYAIWRSLNYVRGPEIEITSPLDGSATSSSMIELSGRALRVNSFSLNGNAMTIDEEGHFHQEVVVFRGVNILTLKAKDQFGRSVARELHIVGI